MPLGSGCLVLRLAATYGMGPLPVALAASYMQRLRHKALAQPAQTRAPSHDVLAGAAFDMLFSRHQGVFCASQDPHQEADCACIDDKRNLAALYVVCLHVAAKLVHRVQRHTFNGLLCRLLHERLSPGELQQVEVWVMRELDWRLAPVRRCDDGDDDDGRPKPAACRRTKRSRHGVDEPPGQKRARLEDSPTDVLAFDRLLLECDEEL